MRKLLTNKKVIIIGMVVLLLVITAIPTFAQTVTLDIDPVQLQNSLFTGANVMITALAAIMFLLAGFRFGGVILRGIVDAITNFRI